MRKRRTFSREFKSEAATMVLDQGHPLAQIRLQLDVSENSLRRWVQQASIIDAAQRFLSTRSLGELRTVIASAQ